MSSLDVASLKVSELKEELAKRGESTAGKKAELAARLTEALKSTTSANKRQQVDLTLDDDDEEAPAAKKARKKKAANAGTGSKSGDDTSPAWWWASDKDAITREWSSYEPAVAAALEAALSKGLAREDVGPSHYVELTPSATAPTSFVQRRKDNPSLSRPVARTTDGQPPVSPPPPPPVKPSKGAKGAKSAGASAAPSAPLASASSKPAVVQKSLKAGGVVQQRYASSGGGGSGSGEREEVACS